MYRRSLFCFLIYSAICLLDFFPTAHAGTFPSQDAPSVTVLCYMNGDNDLSQEVLHALDMMETIGSSERVNVVALVDGHSKWLGNYGAQWDRTRLLRIERDNRIGVIHSTVLESWGEENLGDPNTLEKFIRRSLSQFPADRYIFYMFAHSQGVINTDQYAFEGPGKSLSISRDDTDSASMSLSQFHGAIQRGLGGKRFELMVLFSCLSNMVEVGYTLSDVTDYLVGSEDEIRLYNQPAGRFQIRGLQFEKVLAKLQENSAVDIQVLGKKMVDSHVDNYEPGVVIPAGQGESTICRFAAGMALVDCRALQPLVVALDEMARLLIYRSKDPGLIKVMGDALDASQQFASFLNMEYYDLQGFVRYLRDHLDQQDLQESCDAVINILLEDVLLYERHTKNCGATGLSVYLSNPLVPENIYQVHHSLYLDNQFSKDTQWDEMIDIFRMRLKP